MITILLVCSVVFLPAAVHLAVGSDFDRTESGFKNFVRCELTRTGATDLFNGRPFTITMIDLFDVQTESGIKIATGAVECSVAGNPRTLYVAVGLKEVLEKEQVMYYTIRKNDFTILATELIRYPYKERCQFSPYWIDID